MRRVEDFKSCCRCGWFSGLLVFSCKVPIPFSRDSYAWMVKLSINALHVLAVNISCTTTTFFEAHLCLSLLLSLISVEIKP